MILTAEDLPQRHRITVDEYYRMAEVGLLAPDARVELIEGEIFDMPPTGCPHASVVSRLTRELVLGVGNHALVRCQTSFRLSRWSEPEPDFAVVKPREDYYAQAHPTGPDALALIEISGSTLLYDLNVKAPLYARHGVAELWVVDLKRRHLHFFKGLKDGAYTDISVANEPGRLAVPGLRDAVVDLSWL